MSKKIRTEAVDYLFQAILSLENKEECYTYLEIAEKTGASTATISRVNRSLNYGNDGYDMVFKRVGLAEEKNGTEE